MKVGSGVSIQYRAFLASFFLLDNDNKYKGHHKRYKTNPGLNETSFGGHWINKLITVIFIINICIIKMQEGHFPILHILRALTMCCYCWRPKQGHIPQHHMLSDCMNFRLTIPSPSCLPGVMTATLGCYSPHSILTLSMPELSVSIRKKVHICTSVIERVNASTK